MTSLSKKARVAGLLYILSSVFGVVRLIYIPNTLFVYGNATATANNIAAHQFLFRFGIVSQLLCAVLWIFVTLALYRLLKEVNQGLAVLMILGSVMTIPVFFMNSVNDAAALLFARGGEFLSIFDKPQRDAFALMLLAARARRKPDWAPRPVGVRSSAGLGNSRGLSGGQPMPSDRLGLEVLAKTGDQRFASGNGLLHGG
jgi:Domain of unknown function (DUF4386)